MGEKRTALYDAQVRAGAKMVGFGGYLMPVEYTGILTEHNAVRTGMGMFDLSHMGEFIVQGGEALAAVDAIVTNDVAGLDVGQARYTPMCSESGGVVDDLLVYRYPAHVMLVVNAANIAKDLAWIQAHLPPSVPIADSSDAISLIAVQGPKALPFVQTFCDHNIDSLPYYHFMEATVADVPATVSRTGYTGEDGLELYVASHQALRMWTELLTNGADHGLVPIGLGARDTLRLEAGLLLYGSDITEKTNPLEAGLGWTVKLDDRQFIGADALRKIKESGLSRRLVAFKMLDRTIPRAHYAVRLDTGEGEVTSGTFSPTFQMGIGLAYVPRKASARGTRLNIDIRGSDHPAEIVRKPMYQRPAVAANDVTGV